MEGPGAEYLVIFNDRQLWEAQIQEHSRKARPRAHRLTWPRLTWLAELTSRVRTRSQFSSSCPSEPLVPQHATCGSMCSRARVAVGASTRGTMI